MLKTRASFGPVANVEAIARLRATGISQRETVMLAFDLQKLRWLSFVQQMNQMDEILAESLTAHGTRDLEFELMLGVPMAGQTAGLSLFSVDVTTVGQALPLPE